MRETPSWRVLCFFRCASRSGASLGPRPPRRATRRQGNADLWSAQPAAGGRQRRTPSGPAGMERWCGTRQGSASSAQVSRSRACRPPPGELARGRRSLAAGTIWAVGVPARICIFAATGRRSAVACRLREWRCAGFAGVRPAVRVSALRHHAERRAGKGTPTSGRHSPPQAGGREGPRVACGSPLGRARRHRRRFRAPARADRRSAFPCLRPALPVWRPPPGDLAAFPRRRRREGRKDVWVSHPFGARCRSETGAPLSRAVCVSGYARVSLASGQRCRSRPHATMQSDAQARERRPLVGTARRRRAAGKDPELAGGSPLGRARRHRRRFRAPARAGPHRENCPEVGVPLPAASTAGLEAPTGSTGGVPLLRAFCGGGTLPSAKKGLAANFVRCRRFRGKV